MKCGEERPWCFKCTSTGRKCDGYATQKGENVGQGRNSATAPLQVIAYAIPFSVPGSQRDRQMLHYFCVEAASNLCGYFTSRYGFWSHFALQCSHDEPVVRQALVALSSIHLDYVSKDPCHVKGTDGGALTVETLQQYDKAVRKLRRYLATKEEPLIKVALICCVSFYSFESARGEYDNALEHLHN